MSCADGRNQERPKGRGWKPITWRIGLGAEHTVGLTIARRPLRDYFFLKENPH